MTQSIWVVVGCTGVGKSDVASALAKHNQGTIINADSMQLFKGLEIGAAKPSQAVRRDIEHLLYEFANPGDHVDAYLYAEAAKAAIEDAAKRGRQPIVVGGTGFYIDALFHGLSAAPPLSDDTKKSLDDEVEANGLEAIYAELQQADPTSAARLHPNDAQRIKRALGVYREHNQPFSAFEGGTNFTPPRFPVIKLGVWLERDRLVQRIETRVRAMFAGGILDEVALFPQGQVRGIGYEEAARVVCGEWSLEEAIDKTVVRTRQYAKRQRTWFKRDPEITWFHRDAKSTEEVSGEIEAWLKTKRAR